LIDSLYEEETVVHTRDTATERYYLMIMVYVLPGLALLMLCVHLVTWRETLGQLRRDTPHGHYHYIQFTYLIIFFTFYSKKLGNRDQHLTACQQPTE